MDSDDDVLDLPDHMVGLSSCFVTIIIVLTCIFFHTVVGEAIGGGQGNRIFQYYTSVRFSHTEHVLFVKVPKIVTMTIANAMTIIYWRAVYN